MESGLSQSGYYRATPAPGRFARPLTRPQALPTIRQKSHEIRSLHYPGGAAPAALPGSVRAAGTGHR